MRRVVHARPQSYMILSTAYMIWLFFISTTPLEGSGGWWFPQGFDKVLHMFMYGILAVLLLLAMGFMRRGRRERRQVCIAFSISFTYGVLMELCQFFLEHRTFSVADIAANGIGAAFALALFVWLHGRRRIPENR